MPERHFTLDEAHALLPVLESLLRSAMESKKQVDNIGKEFQDLAHKVFLSGGMLLPVTKLTHRKAERDKAVQQVRDAVTEINATGVQVKDLEIGLLDFPCETEAGTILLCWKMGESKITHWHGTDEGFAGRKPIDARILKAGTE
jgi:hypothetical protein